MVNGAVKVRNVAREENENARECWVEEGKSVVVFFDGGVVTFSRSALFSSNVRVYLSKILDIAR